MMESIINAIIGGALIGLAASLLFLANGRIAGISGILGQALKVSTPDRRWRMTFIAGLLVGGMGLMNTMPEVIVAPSTRTIGAVAIAGLLVGIGTRMGSGCTSGHGVCGLTRFSGRSLAATIAFMATGFATATVIQLAMGGAL
jgi:uncharacterized membrane protein YedE/YeeE